MFNASVSAKAEIRSLQEFPSIFQFCSAFREALALPDFNLTELEQALLVPSCRLIGEIHYRLIHATEANADKRNRYQVLDNQDQWQYDFRVVFANHIADAANCTLFNKQETHWAAHVWPEDVPYESLPATARVRLLYGLCCYRLDQDDRLSRAADAASSPSDMMTMEPVGVDMHGSIYWTFSQDGWLFKEEMAASEEASGTAFSHISFCTQPEIEQSEPTPEASVEPEPEASVSESNGDSASSPSETKVAFDAVDNDHSANGGNNNGSREIDAFYYLGPRRSGRVPTTPAPPPAAAAAAPTPSSARSRPSAKKGKSATSSTKKRKRSASSDEESSEDSDSDDDSDPQRAVRKAILQQQRSVPSQRRQWKTASASYWELTLIYNSLIAEVEPHLPPQVAQQQFSKPPSSVLPGSPAPMPQPVLPLPELKTLPPNVSNHVRLLLLLRDVVIPAAKIISPELDRAFHRRLGIDLFPRKRSQRVQQLATTQLTAQQQESAQAEASRQEALAEKNAAREREMDRERRARLQRAAERQREKEKAAESKRKAEEAQRAQQGREARAARFRANRGLSVSPTSFEQVIHDSEVPTSPARDDGELAMLLPDDFMFVSGVHPRPTQLATALAAAVDAPAVVETPSTSETTKTDAPAEKSDVPIAVAAVDAMEVDVKVETKPEPVEGTDSTPPADTPVAIPEAEATASTSTVVVPEQSPASVPTEPAKSTPASQVDDFVSDTARVVRVRGSTVRVQYSMDYYRQMWAAREESRRIASAVKASYEAQHARYLSKKEATREEDMAAKAAKREAMRQRQYEMSQAQQRQMALLRQQQQALQQQQIQSQQYLAQQQQHAMYLPQQQFAQSLLNAHTVYSAEQRRVIEFTQQQQQRLQQQQQYQQQQQQQFQQQLQQHMPMRQVPTYTHQRGIQMTDEQKRFAAQLLHDPKVAAAVTAALTKQLQSTGQQQISQDQVLQVALLMHVQMQEHNRNAAVVAAPSADTSAPNPSAAAPTSENSSTSAASPSAPAAESNPSTQQQ